jgi:hypothetical protein
MMPTQRYDQQNGVFVLSEPGKAITFTPADRSIGVHSDDSPEGIPAYQCEYVGPDAFCDVSFSAGTKLLQRWEDSGRFNDVVWDELHRWFDSKFPAGT